MDHRCIVSTSLLMLSLLTQGCDDAARKERKAEQAQSEADQKKAAAQQQAEQKTAEAWDAAERDMQQAQQRADRAWDAAATALGSEKDDYLVRVNRLVSELDGKLGELRESAHDAATVPEKKLAQDVADNVQRRRNALLADATAIALTASDAWPALRLKLDTDLDESRSYLRTASARIRSSAR